ncbi:molybdopterin-synthase adenylyltransferase MoeB [Paraglaciecola marina]|uniref:molybdopterin-synthase adenylyltransferase MoeB n=1 Tax=Paraglaciecola marina TaxID=2500157 RepID=UPI00105B276E|nr:molybdopterin-synthase adenylyltransferase MoeB [Paraglaciecola marina]
MLKRISSENAIRYSRQILLSGFDLEKQEILLNSSVLQIGVGGLGCAAAQYLVAAGVGHITLVDDDKVDESNLQRQILHTEASVGLNKCESAKQALTALNSDAKIDIIQQRLSDDKLSEQVKAHDIVIDCSDNIETRNQLNRICIKQQKPLVSGAAIRMEGQLSSFLPSANNPCYECLSTMFTEQSLTCVEAGVMSPVVGIVGAMQALECIKILTDFGKPLTNKLMMFDGKSMEWQTYTIPKSTTCSACSAL